MASEKSVWDSNIAFVLAMIGSAVGLGNIWRFPNVLYSNGGGSFMIPYIVSLFILGISFVLVEYAVGFKFKTSLSKIFFTIKSSNILCLCSCLGFDICRFEPYQGMGCKS